MKLLFVIPHYYNPAGKAGHGSAQAQPTRRMQALAEVILAIHQQFGPRQCEIDIFKRTAIPANTENQHEIEIVLCTTGENHLINDFPLPSHLFKHHPTHAEPLLLGFECHRVLAENLGHYDYYCFLEDDIVIQDALFFHKLAQFNRYTSVLDLLQPNRYEVSHRTLFQKAYVDGDIRPGATLEFQDVTQHPMMEGQLLGLPVKLRRPLNPHSGCFFLNAEQMRYWAEQPYFLDRDVRFVSPLESAASLGIMKTFRIYKPDRQNASFFEVKHADTRFIHLIGTQVAVERQNTSLMQRQKDCLPLKN